MGEHENKAIWGNDFHFLPFEESVQCQFCSAVADRHVRVAAILSYTVELAGNPNARDRVINHSGQAFPGEVIDDTQNAEPPAVQQRIGYEVQAPALIGAFWRLAGLSSVIWSPKRACSRPACAQ